MCGFNSTRIENLPKLHGPDSEAKQLVILKEGYPRRGDVAMVDR